MSRSPFDITHALECHGQALRQLALELVRDANVADDAVQEVWLAALQRPPRHQDALRGWFATALHNVVRVWRRKQLRRARHEAAVADRERVDRGESVAREEIGRRLLTAVESLAAPYREVVWQRYFEGKAPREIAAALREPLATVKSRLQRGLAMLRERLGEGADGGDWQRAFVVAFGLREGTAAASVAAVMTGGVLVATWTKGLAAAVAAIAVVVMLWWPRDAVVPPVVAAGESAAGAMAQRAAPGAQVVAGEAASGEHVPRREAVASASPDEAKVATIRGRCVDEAGNAIAGCTASLLGYGGRSDESAQDDWVLEHGDERLEQNTRTAVDGTFELAFVPPPPFVVFLSLQGEGWARIGRSWDRIEPGAVHDLGTIVMTPGVLVRGRVVDAAGQPLEWLQVDTERGPTPMTRPASTLAPASYAAARTKENGAFAFDLSLPPGAYALRLSGDYRVASPSPLVLDGKVPVIDIEVRTAPLPEVPTITGVVADDAERPVWGALVTWQQQGGAVVDGSYSGRDGRFTLRCKTGSAAEPVRIVASQYGHVTATLADAVAWGSRDVRVRMQRGADLTVRIHDVQGRPVAGAAVRLMPGDAAQWGMTHGVAEKARTDAGGQATMTRIVPGTYLVVVQFAPSRGLLPIFERVVVDRAPVRLELRVGMESSRRLRVQRTDGRFVAGAQVQLCEMLGNAFGPKCLLLPRARWFQSNNLPRILVIAELETDADGAALLRGPGGRALGLRVSGAGHLGIELDDLRLDVAGDLLVTVPSGARLHGAVVPPEAVAELRRLAGVEVGEAMPTRSRPHLRLRRDTLFVPDPTAAALAADATTAKFVVGDDGAFDIGGLPAGVWSVELCYTVRGESMRMTRAIGLGTQVLQDGGSTAITADLTLLLPGTVQALVQRGGQPWTQAMVAIVSSHGAGADGREVRETVFARTDAAGRLQWQGRPGRYWLRTSDDDTVVALPTIEVARGMVMRVTFEFDLGEVAVRVLAPDGLPAKQVELHAAERQWLAVTGIDGSATIVAKPGPLTLRVLPNRMQSEQARNEMRLRSRGEGDPFAAHWIEVGTVNVVAGRTTPMELRLPAAWDR